MIRFGGTNLSSFFGGNNSYSSLYGSLSQLNSIKNGSYGKALKAYYAKENYSAPIKSAKKVNNSRYNYPSYTANGGLDAIQAQTGKLTESVNRLTDNSKKGLFADKDNYDADAAYKAVSEFVTEYNATVDAVNKTTNKAVSNAAGSMIRMTGIMSNSLSKVGVTIGKDGRLSVDADEFKSADMDKVKSVFGPGGSFSRSVGSYASRLGNSARQQSMLPANNTGVYGRYGSYNNDYGSGSYNWWY